MLVSHLETDKISETPKTFPVISSLLLMISSVISTSFPDIIGVPHIGSVPNRRCSSCRQCFWYRRYFSFHRCFSLHRCFLCSRCSQYHCLFLNKAKLESRYFGTSRVLDCRHELLMIVKGFFWLGFTWTSSEASSPSGTRKTRWKKFQRDFLAQTKSWSKYMTNHTMTQSSESKTSQGR